MIDVSILRRYGFETIDESHRSIAPNGKIIMIRSEYSLNPTRNIETAPPIIYKFTSPEKTQALEYFLQNLFRKKEFRKGQKEIIQHALARQNTIGLLPTGAGKSLCYQLVTFLQPCLTIVIDPIRSLMIDQVRNLEKYSIDACAFISSDLTAEEKRITQKRFGRGEYQITFISPERLQIHEFRNFLETVASYRPICYAVIDEAHCVSEWGHDFRTSYLMMAKTIRKFCQFHGEPPTFYALTGTASIAVLEDIKLDLGISKEDENEGTIITPLTFDRPELKFYPRQIESNRKFECLREIFQDICDRLHTDMNSLFIPNGQDTFSGLLFCPHVRSTDYAIESLKTKVGNEFHFQIGYLVSSA